MTYEETQKIKHLRKVTSVMVEESSNGIECTKNRFGNRTLDGCKNVTFEKIELSLTFSSKFSITNLQNYGWL